MHSVPVIGWIDEFDDEHPRFIDDMTFSVLGELDEDNIPSINHFKARSWPECVELVVEKTRRKGIENAYSFQWFALAASLAPTANYELGKKETPKFID
ncbi:hypothetical protein N7510_011400 [Penicillium lagena]|uniref:uncharacterized protein n=1 Tax=Penicillium lagena TaxID=94218 RepID=UPI00253F9772|nr:uncharacterized protein N7510_011400 [Penicillium lagena]KAJ5601866.1 hypothetical protein N7510_011400 [Penicillium lagena]